MIGKVSLAIFAFVLSIAGFTASAESCTKCVRTTPPPGYDSSGIPSQRCQNVCSEVSLNAFKKCLDRAYPGRRLCALSGGRYNQPAMLFTLNKRLFKLYRSSC